MFKCAETYPHFYWHAPVFRKGKHGISLECSQRKSREVKNTLHRSVSVNEVVNEINKIVISVVFVAQDVINVGM